MIKFGVITLTVVRVILRDLRGIFCEDNSKTTLKMPVNVAMEEPRAWVVRFETEGDVVARSTNIHRVAADGVDEIVLGTTSDAYNIKGMAVQVEGVVATARDVDLIRFVGVEVVHAARREKVCCRGLAAQDLQQHGYAGRVEWRPIDREFAVSTPNQQLDCMVDTAYDRLAWNWSRVERVQVGLVQDSCLDKGG